MNTVKWYPLAGLSITPAEEGEYLVTLTGGVVCGAEYSFPTDQWRIHGILENDVLAWAEMPEGYAPPVTQEDTKPCPQ